MQNIRARSVYAPHGDDPLAIQQLRQRSNWGSFHLPQAQVSGGSPGFRPFNMSAFKISYSDQSPEAVAKR